MMQDHIYFVFYNDEIECFLTLKEALDIAAYYEMIGVQTTVEINCGECS